jgi:RIO-like serine/threonine protein kinase
MAEVAFDLTISELIWMGIEPSNVHNLASTLYPDEELILDETNLQDWIDYIINFDFSEFNIFCPNENFIDYEDEIKNSNNICKTNIYIDGSNLTKSFQYLKEEVEVKDEIKIRTISRKLENYT